MIGQKIVILINLFRSQIGKEIFKLEEKMSLLTVVKKT